MRVTVAQLEALFWVARLGSIQRAADQLNLAQPTVSLRLRDLERSTDSALLDRGSRGVKLTANGKLVLDHAKAVITEIDKIRERLQGAEDPQGVVRLGVTENFALIGLPVLLQQLSASYPLLQLDMVVATSARLEKGTAEGDLDIAVIASPMGDDRLHQVPLGHQELVWAASPKWELPATVRPKDIHHLPIITSPPPESLHRHVTNWFRTADLEPLSLSLCDSVTVVAELISAGVAIGLLPRRMIEAKIGAGYLTVLDCQPGISKTPVFAVWRRPHESAATGAVLKMIRQTLVSIDLLALPPG